MKKPLLVTVAMMALLGAGCSFAPFASQKQADGTTAAETAKTPPPEPPPNIPKPTPVQQKAM